MRTAMLVSVVSLLLLLPAMSQAELLKIVDVAGINQVVFAAYEDNQVWRGGGPPTQLTDVNRNVPIKRMQARYSGLLILYADDQVYLAGMYSGFEFFVDAHREGASVVDMDCQDGNMIPFAYDDGQVWIWTSGTGLFRWEDLDREDLGAACCQPDGTCMMATEANCPAPGVWQGWGTDCDPNPCLVGACCHHTYCERMSEAQCVGYDGVFMGPGSFCEPNPCVSGVEDATQVSELRLTATPNPSTGQVMIRYTLPRPTAVTIEVFDAAGGLVRRVDEGQRPAGAFFTPWDGHDDNGRDLPTGVYFARIVTGEGSTTGRVVLAR